MRAAGQVETTPENIQDWLMLDEGDPGFQLLIEEEISAVIFCYLFSLALPILFKFSSYLNSKVFCLLFLGLPFA
jgi:hypothetical protein